MPLTEAPDTFIRTKNKVDDILSSLSSARVFPLPEGVLPPSSGTGSEYPSSFTALTPAALMSPQIMSHMMAWVDFTSVWALNQGLILCICLQINKYIQGHAVHFSSGLEI